MNSYENLYCNFSNSLNSNSYSICHFKIQYYEITIVISEFLSIFSNEFISMNSYLCIEDCESYDHFIYEFICNEFMYMNSHMNSYMNLG